MPKNTKNKKIKREIPLRTSGETVNSQTTRPSLFLFDEVKRLENLDSQRTGEPIANENIIGNPNFHILESQTNDIGYPEQNALDSQIVKGGNPNTNILEIQTPVIGNPNDENLDSLIAKPKKRIAKETADLDSKIADSENLDSQSEAKTGKWKKYDGARARKGIFLRTDNEITKRFKQFCIEHELDFSQGTELAWEKFMKDLDSQKTDDLDSRIALNNKQVIMMWKSKPHIINIYYAYNKFFTSRVRWTAKDDRTGQNYNEVDPRILELGIIQTQCNLFAENADKSTTINGFQYYTSEIKKFMMYEERPEVLDTILKINREAWVKQSGKSIDYSSFEIKAEEI